MNTILLAELKPYELKEIAKEKPLILIPVGTTEWHADHLPLGVDSLLSQALCFEISAQTGCIVAPLISYGICRNLKPEAGYFGTVDTIRGETLSSLLIDLSQSYSKMGFRKAVLLTGHGEPGHWEAINTAIASVHNIELIMLSAYDFSKDKMEELHDLEETWPYATDHAAEWETSLMLHFHPNLVDMAKAPETIELRMAGIPEYLHKRYPRRASLEYGYALSKVIVSGGVQAITNLLGK